MPLPKRIVEPVYVSRNTIPENYPLPNELEAVTNGTLANTIRQLSSLSRHAEDLFGELAREAHGIATRANNLQARIDRLAIKVTQLDSNVEEVSLQDTHSRKAFKSTVLFDQQVVSRDTMPTAMLETYQVCDKPPPLDKLNPYREDGKDGLKFYTDPNYFFDLWRREMLKDTERMMHDRGKKPHRPRQDGSAGGGGGGGGGGGRHKKRVRQPHNTRERQREIAVGHGEYIMPQSVHYRTPQPILNPDEGLLGMEKMVVTDPRPPRPNSIELKTNYPDEGVWGVYSPNAIQSPANNMHYRYDDAAAIYQQQQNYAQGQAVTMMNADYVDSNNHTPSRNGVIRQVNTSSRPSQPPPAPPSATNSNTSTPTANNTPTRGRSMSAGRDQLPPPPPPPNDVLIMSPHSLLARQNSSSRSGSPQLVTTANTTPTGLHLNHVTMRQTGEDVCETSQDMLPPPPPVPSSPPAAAANIPPPPPPPPPFPNGDVCKSPVKQANFVNVGKNVIEPVRKSVNPVAPIIDPRNDLLKAIRDGIKLRKVEKIEQKEVERVNALHDVASILARRVAVEFSDSDSASESEYDSEGWAEQETCA